MIMFSGSFLEVSNSTPSIQSTYGNVKLAGVTLCVVLGNKAPTNSVLSVRVQEAQHAYSGCDTS